MPVRGAGAPAEWDARLSVPGSPVCAPEWLALREPADAAARAGALVAALVGTRPRPDGPWTVADLGCGTGAMGRWLVPRLPGPQRWTLHDRDPALLAAAVAGTPRAAADGAPVTARARAGDLAALRAADLAGTGLVVASALLDLLTGDEVAALADACTAAGCAALLTLSVTGRVRLHPHDRLDAAFAAAFDAHQRRADGGRRLLGPDAGPAAAAAFARRGASVRTAASPWRLGPADAALAEEWLRGWIGAACVQEPALAAVAGGYLRRRLAAAAAGALRVTVGHVDVLALPAGAP